MHKPLQYLGKYESSESSVDTWIVSYVDVQLYEGEYLEPQFKDTDPLEIAAGSYSFAFSYKIKGTAQGDPFTSHQGPICIHILSKFGLDHAPYADLAAKIAYVKGKLSERLKKSDNPVEYARFEVTVTVIAPDGGSSTNTIGKDDTIEIVA